MSLELEKVIGQIINMAEHLKQKYPKKKDMLDLALELMNSEAADIAKLKKRIENAKTTWLIAGIDEVPNKKKHAVSCPENYIVIAVDGSHIDVDRHRSAHCFLLNTGGVQIEYGENPSAHFFNQPRLFYKEDEISLPSDNNRKVLIEGQVLGIKRTVEELNLLTDKTAGLKNKLPVLALLDGTLTLWGIIGLEYPNSVIRELVEKGFLKYLDCLYEVSKSRQTALASYISFPRSTEVVNLLRIILCPYDDVNCDYYCGNSGTSRVCDKVNGLIDRDIFGSLLKSGERSATFSSRSSVVKNYYGAHNVKFFYLKLEEEVARVEVPVWVAENTELMDLTHAILLRQCASGFGYPVTLMEAHEKAVITGADREQFWRVVEQEMVKDKILLGTSAKNWSKRIKWL